jgi:hypothetical protein
VKSRTLNRNSHPGFYIIAASYYCHYRLDFIGLVIFRVWMNCLQAES